MEYIITIDNNTILDEPLNALLDNFMKRFNFDKFERLPIIF